MDIESGFYTLNLDIMDWIGVRAPPKGWCNIPPGRGQLGLRGVPKKNFLPRCRWAITLICPETEAQHAHRGLSCNIFSYIMSRGGWRQGPQWSYSVAPSNPLSLRHNWVMTATWNITTVKHFFFFKWITSQQWHKKDFPVAWPPTRRRAPKHIMWLASASDKHLYLFFYLVIFRDDVITLFFCPQSSDFKESANSETQSDILALKTKKNYIKILF